MNKEVSGKICVGERDCPAWLKEEAGVYSISAVHLHSLTSVCTSDFWSLFPFRATWAMSRSASKNYFQILSSAISFLSDRELTCQRECVSGLVSEYLHACKTIFCSMSDVEHDKETNIYGLNHGKSGVSWSYPVTSLENSIQLCGKLRRGEQKIEIFLDLPFFFPVEDVLFKASCG